MNKMNLFTNTRFILIVLILMSFLYISCNTQETSKSESKTLVKSDTVKVYYFHYTHRCKTCEAVEKVALEALNTMFSDKVKLNTLIFKSINIEDETNNSIVESLKIDGQTLLIVSDSSRIDLTDIAFMNAVKSPEKLKNEIKTNLISLYK